MSDFYVRDVDFGSGHNPLQAPVLLSWVAANQGFLPPDPGRPFTYCDLGCGNGTTLVGLAAVHTDCQFVGVDFNEGHVQQARQLASDAGVENAKFHLSSFSDFDSLALPTFDYIGMNGVYSWLHTDVVRAVHDFLASHLAENGLFVVEYLTLPGAAAVAPMWKLMRELTSHTGGGPLERAAKGLETLAMLRRRNAGYFTDNPRQSGLIGQLSEQPEQESLLAWLAHSSLADSWHPKYFTEVALELGDAGLTFAGSVQLAMNDITLSIPEAMHEMFDGLCDEGQIELLKDFTLNRSQRTDVFIKQAEPSGPAARELRGDGFCVVACGSSQDARTAVKRAGRALPRSEKDLCLQLVDQLCATDQPIAIRDLVGGEPRALTRLLLSDLFQIHSRRRAPHTGTTSCSGRWVVPLQLNRRSVEQAAAALEPTALVIANGACIRLSGFEALVLWAHVTLETSAAREEFVTAAVGAHGAPILVGGEVTTPDWITASQIEQAIHDFEAGSLPLLARLGLVGPEKAVPEMAP